MTTRRRYPLSGSVRLAILAMAAGGGGYGHAQEVAEQEQGSPKSATTLEAIKVSALKRETKLQETPVSISAVEAQTLKDMGASGFQDYFRSVPSLQIVGDSPTSRRVTMRGIRSTGEPTVGVYYDETPLSGPAGTSQDASSTVANMDLFDVERLEILRGPQGTLYGSGSMGGTIRMIFNKPDASAYSGAFETDYGQTRGAGDPNTQYKAMVNVPIVKDVLAARAVLYKSESAGYIDNVRYDRKDINDSSSKGGRVMLRLTPNEAITLDASAVFQKSEQSGQNSWYEGLGKYNNDDYTIAQTDDDMHLYNMTLNWDLGWATLTTSASYYKWSLQRTSDYTRTLSRSTANATSCKNYINAIYDLSIDSCDSEQMATYTTYAESRLPSALYQPMMLRSRNYEARLSGLALDDRLAWTGGVYHENRDDTIESMVAKTDESTGMVIHPLDLSAWRHVGTEMQQTAIFGEATWSVTDKFDLTYGVRRYDYDKKTYGQVYISNYITQSYVGDYSEVNASASGYVSKFNASYRFTPDIMGYATAAKGFRPGGANNVPGLDASLVAYGPDSLWNYELGLKTEWWNHRAQLNAAIFQIDWSNMQVSGTSANGAFSYITNAGAARIRGVELEGTVRPLAGLTLNGMLTYMDGRLTEDQTNSNLAMTNSTGRKGDKIPYVPDWSASASVAYNWPIGSTSLYGMARVDYSYVGESGSYFRKNYVYYDTQGNYSLVNLRTGVESGKWALYLYVNNLMDKVGVITRSTGSGYDNELLTLRPRTVGLTFRTSFE